MTAEQVFGKEYVAERIHCRQRQSRCRTSVAVDDVVARHHGGVPMQELLREAIAAMT